MFVAKAAALRSCDLSRQVGAVIVDRQNAILATGCNEVPYPDGGIYFEGRNDGIGDNRDKEKGNDPNYVEIQKTLIELIGVLQSTGHIASEPNSKVVSEELLHGGNKELMKNARIRNLIEFGRVVHAEMHALSQAASLGRAVQGSTLFCTTFPCHGCARHIISSGVHEVVFIEPYPKSLTRQLYDGEIQMVDRSIGDDDRAPFDRVRFRPFHGVSPTLYQRVFAFRDRKDDHGVIAKWAPKKAIPLGASFGVARESIEFAAANSVAEILERIRVESQ